MINRVTRRWKKYKTLSWQENFFGGHINIGNITIYGENAMHWAVNIRNTPWGYVCFRLPIRCFGQWWPLYLYASPNATPWGATFYLGNKNERLKAKKRLSVFGHNFSISKHEDELFEINNKF